MTVPAGMQVCFLANGNNGAFNFSTCGRTTDDTFITLLDAFGNVITSDDNDCDEPQSLQSFISFDVSTGATVCVQVESITNGVCDGTNSTSPNYTLEIQCDVFPDNFVQVSEDANQCVIVGFNELQTIIFEDSVTDFNSFVFNTDATEQMGNFTSGSLTICAQGDIGGSENFWQIDDENGNCVGGIGNVPNGQCSDEPFCTSFNFDGAEVAAMVADGFVSFGVFNLDGEISAFCDTNLLSLELNLCADPVIPTMGEWGLICLGLILLSFSIVAIRQKQFVLN